MFLKALLVALLPAALAVDHAVVLGADDTLPLSRFELFAYRFDDDQPFFGKQCLPSGRRTTTAGTLPLGGGWYHSFAHVHGR
ncbi:hypothetical protein FB45DRAFT_1021336 [Roridomyces roridus]|uniref:Uncharacterized protein n=1 Tax=Roridomyces roridus TaxID=1738132 RepID=A0AAD7CBT7_9AGAR|nr:hypothetical protein FB45DRAFT_1021336 [Roridomyces roridus]